MQEKQPEAGSQWDKVANKNILLAVKDYKELSRLEFIREAEKFENFAEMEN